MPVRSERDMQDRLRALRQTSAHDWMFVLATGDIAERAGGAVVPVTDLERHLLGYVPVSAIAGAARALVQARAVLCPARFETTAESGELSLALDGEFLMRRLDDRLAAIDPATSQ
ncbi:MAG: hypothetical protein IT184_03220 [Acidobacteria bacterium]|nr:hypothetical protein [Acidobacteriota bacterium]